MLYMLQGWLPGSSRFIRSGERVFIGDHAGLERILHARGLTILALCGRLFLLTVEMTARTVHHG